MDSGRGLTPPVVPEHVTWLPTVCVCAEGLMQRLNKPSSSSLTEHSDEAERCYLSVDGSGLAHDLCTVLCLPRDDQDISDKACTPACLTLAHWPDRKPETGAAWRIWLNQKGDKRCEQENQRVTMKKGPRHTRTRDATVLV